MYPLQNKVNGKKTADLVQLVLAGSRECFTSGQKGRFARPALVNFDLINLHRKRRQDTFDFI